jgi:type I restriction enzyme S subunit
MELNREYKQSELGAIPRDWNVIPIGDVCQIVGRIGFRGYTVNDIVKEGGGAIAISPSNIQDGAVNFNKCTYISWEKYEESPEIKIQDGDIILVKTGSTFGKTAIVKGLPERATLNPQLVVLKKIKINNFYLGYMMGYRVVQDQISAFIVGGALPTLSQRLVAKFILPIPSTKAEQEAIAQALSDADALIESLDQLIAKKRQIKQGAMQELLTGKRRLPGFSGEWEMRRLGELADMGSGGTPPSSNPSFYDGEIPWVAIADMTKGGKFISHTERNLSDEGFSNCAAQMFSAGTVLYAMYASLGECSIASVPLSSSQAILGIRVKEKLNNEFLYYYLQSIKPKVKTLGQQGTQANLNKGMVQDFSLQLPPVIEQTAIATILSDMDTELAALESRHAKVRQIKQGMMQELLTGRIRLL